MRPSRVLLAVSAAVALSACGFEEPPGADAPNPSLPAVPPVSGVTDACTAFALSLLDGQLDGLPSAAPEEAEKGAAVADQFQQQYDEVIAESGVEAARERYLPEIATACAE